MTPILLAGDTVKGFLPDATSCVVTEERNGIFEMELTYPVAGPMFGELAVDRYIKAKPNDTAALQLFRIYEITKPISGIVTVRCEHVSYALAHYPVTNVSGSGTAAQAVGAVLAKVNTYLTLSHAFSAIDTGWTASKSYKFQIGSARAALGGTEGSLLDTFGGEFEWDNYNVKLHQHRGSDTGVVVAYRKNMTDLKVTTSLDSAYTALFPYAIKDDVLITIDGGKIAVTNSSGIEDRVLIRDFSSEFQGDEEVTAAALLTKANAYLAANNINAPAVSCTVSFVHLWQSPEYSSLAALERVSLCDWVTIRHEILGVDVKAQVIKTEYDCLAERYNVVELGSARANFQDTLQQTIHDVTDLLKNSDTSAITAAYMQAIADATALITGVDGGYVHLLPSGTSPQEIVISDIEDYTSNTAKVWRWNQNGLGYSSTGYSGTYTTAITADGKINASMITTGYLNASRITAGVLQSADHSAVFNLDYNYLHTEQTSGGHTRGARMTSGAYRLLYDTHEIGALGTIEGGTPYLYFNTAHASELIIGYGSSGSTHGMIAVQTDKVHIYGENYEAAKFENDGCYFNANNTQVASVQEDGIHGNLVQFRNWYAQNTEGGYAYDYNQIWTAINGKAAANHNHDGAYLPQSWYSQNTEGGYTYDYNQIWAAINGKAAANHTHSGYAASNHSHNSIGDSSGASIWVAGTNLVSCYKEGSRYNIDVSSSANIDVVGTNFVSDFYYVGRSLSNYRGYFYDSGDGVAFRTSSENLKIFFTVGVYMVGYFDSSGYHGSVNASSSEKIKRNIEVCPSALDLVRDSKVYTFNYLKNPDNPDDGIRSKRSTGFIVERETPEEVISESGDSIDLYSMAALNWRATQELLEKVERLEAQHGRR